jgi:ADP-ribose pyrophosphatase YjhB (NUDIX family)
MIDARDVGNEAATRPAVRPVPAAIAVVVRGDEVLLVRRANPPDLGLWGFPGGKIDFGETVAAAATRELWEETGVRGEALRAFAAVDVFDRAADGALMRHFILNAVLCRWLSGDPVAADDALEARWFGVAALDPGRMAMSLSVDAIARQGLGLARGLDPAAFGAQP